MTVPTPNTWSKMWSVRMASIARPPALRMTRTSAINHFSTRRWRRWLDHEPPMLNLKYSSGIKRASQQETVRLRQWTRGARRRQVDGARTADDGGLWVWVLAELSKGWRSLVAPDVVPVFSNDPLVAGRDGNSLDWLLSTTGEGTDTARTCYGRRDP